MALHRVVFPVAVVGAAVLAAKLPLPVEAPSRELAHVKGLVCEDVLPLPVRQAVEPLPAVDVTSNQFDRGLSYLMVLGLNADDELLMPHLRLMSENAVGPQLERTLDRGELNIFCVDRAFGGAGTAN